MFKKLLGLFLLISSVGLAQTAGTSPKAGTSALSGGSGGGGVSITGIPSSGQITLWTGAGSISGDPGLTWTGTGTSFIATFGGGVEISNGGFGAGGWASFWGASNGGLTMGSGNLVGWDSATSHPGYNRTGIDLALSRASAGTLLVEDGSGNARDVQARTLTFGSTVPASLSANVSGYVLLTDNVAGAKSVVLGAGILYPNSDNTQALGTVGAAWSSGLFGTALYSPLLAAGQGKTGTNVAGTNSLIQAEPGTGSATGSSIVFQTPTAGASGTTGQTQTTRMTVSEAGVGVGTTATASLEVKGVSGNIFQVTNSANNVALVIDNANLNTKFYPGGLSSPTVTATSDTNTGIGWGGSDTLSLVTGGVAAVQIDANQNAIFAAPVRLKGYTVATLPAGVVGDTAYVTDATAPTYLGALTGGGAVTCPVMYNGSAWVSH